MIALPGLRASGAEPETHARPRPGAARVADAADFPALLDGAVDSDAATRSALRSLSKDKSLADSAAAAAVPGIAEKPDGDDVRAQGATLNALLAMLPAIQTPARAASLEGKGASDADEKRADGDRTADLSALPGLLLPSAPAPEAAIHRGAADDDAVARGATEALRGSPAKRGAADGPHPAEIAAQDVMTPDNTRPPEAGSAQRVRPPLSAPAAADGAINFTAPVPPPGSGSATVSVSPTADINARLGTPEWQQSVSQHITLFTRQGEQRAELTLHPQDLGQITISMKLDDNQAQLQMLTGHGHVRAALEAALPQLRSQLADSGIQLAQSFIGSDASPGQQHADRQPPPAFSPAEGNAHSADDKDSPGVPASLRARARGDGAVDTFA